MFIHFYVNQTKEIVPFYMPAGIVTFKFDLRI